MATDFISLFAAALIAALSPIIARLVPRGLVPETVILLLAGALLGPYMAGIIQTTDSIEMIAELGLAFLFLLAGYEINPRSLSGTQGKKGLATWAVSILMAFAAVALATELSPTSTEGIAVAIALTTTALGTLMPILKERGLMESPVGQTVIAFGTWGELGPVLAMALLLSARSAWASAAILGGMLVLCVLIGLFAKGFQKRASRVFGFVVEGSQTTSQTYVRLTVLLLVALVAFSAVFDLDIVLGAFAAGFVLRYVVPPENHTLEMKLEAMAYGFFIPLFFIVSGVKIDLSAVGAKPLMLVGFIALLLLVRFLPIMADLWLNRETRRMTWANRVSVALYCTTALPIIVAVTGLAVNADAMTSETASVLVCAGAVTVLIMPLLALVIQRAGDARPVQAIKEMSRDPERAGEIAMDHIELSRELAQERKEEERELKKRAAIRRYREYWSDDSR